MLQIETIFAPGLMQPSRDRDPQYQFHYLSVQVSILRENINSS